MTVTQDDVLALLHLLIVGQFCLNEPLRPSILQMFASY